MKEKRMGQVKTERKRRGIGEDKNDGCSGKGKEEGQEKIDRLSPVE